MPEHKKEYSLITRFRIALGAILLLVFVGMLSSIQVTESVSGMGSAVNDAGSLRMLAYQIGSNLQTESEPEKKASTLRFLSNQFSTRINGPIVRRPLQENGNPRLHKAYAGVVMGWQRISALLQQSIALHHSGQLDIERNDRLQAEYLYALPGFVSVIDNMVKEIELEVENKIQTLHIIQISSLFLILIVVAAAIYAVNESVIRPLDSLMSAVDAIRRGDFSFRASYKDENEIGKLSSTFNAMASELSDSYAEKEKELEQKNTDLKRKKSGLELLSTTSQILANSPTSSESYAAILKEIRKFLNITGGVICLSKPDSDDGHLLASYPEPAACDKECENDCTHCHTTPKVTFTRMTIPIKNRNNTIPYGLLILDADIDALDEWERMTLRVIAEQMASAFMISKSSLREQENLLNLERSNIARELHDSIAQSLSYLKIETSRLQQLLPRLEETHSAHEIAQNIRAELNNAYARLRELLTTFRLTLRTEEIAESIAQSVKEFHGKSGLEISLDNRLGNCSISPHEAVHLIYILREALNNIQKHAQAAHASVWLHCSGNKQITLRIEDNGIGFDQKNKKSGHYGLSIMHERAQSLNGTLEINPRNGGGTTIQLRFIPLLNHAENAQDITSWLQNL
jgi:two-component system nitrate/nitrite sensor histidine kinase NarX